jgi:hypothetical protein
MNGPQAGLVFAGAKYGGPIIKLLSEDDLRR